MLVIETRNLTKRYGARIVAVDNLDLTVRRGEIYGFLGPNGAGKTTTLRMLLGLIKATSGTARVLGEEPGTPKQLSRVGAMIEAPAFYPYLSGRDNLKVVARYCGEISARKVEQVLAEVDLTSRAKDKFKNYSMGMKQRLGIAAALLKDPDLFILDEPTNGLDPKGIAQMRELVRSLTTGRRTVLLSSHQMAEVEQICDRVGIIRKGRLVAEGTVDELVGKQGLSVKAEPLEEAALIASRLSGVAEVKVIGETLRLTTDPERAGEITHKLVSAGIRVAEVRPVRRSLEEAFFELTEGG